MDFVLSREWSVSRVGTYTHLHYSLAAGLTPQALDLFLGAWLRKHMVDLQFEAWLG
jgi:hypothetical protein